MSDMKIDTVRSSNSGVLGRARSEARGHRIVLDSSSRPQPDAFTNSEAFLAGVSSCGVTLIETHAKEIGVPMKGIDVTIEGARALGFDADYGTIEPGKSARLVAVDVPAGTGDVEEYLVSGIERGQIRWIEESPIG